MSVNPITHDVIPGIANRWSPYRFEPKAIPSEHLTRCFEAARWAASSFNEQPWRWIVATREESEEFGRMLGCLMEANQQWAEAAGALVLTAYRSKFSRNEKPNRVALHDLGQAAALFSIQAAELGLQVHQMGGINLSQIRTEYRIPDEFEPATAIAIGYPDPRPPADEAAQQLQSRETSARQRNSLSDQVFSSSWGNPARR